MACACPRLRDRKEVSWLGVGEREEVKKPHRVFQQLWQRKKKSYIQLACQDRVGGSRGHLELLGHPGRGVIILVRKVLAEKNH